MDKQKNIALSQEARSENTSGDRLKELAALNNQLAQIVASNVSAPPELLEELINRESKLIRRAVIGNPNTPVETLFKLGAHYFPQELLNNPTFQLLYLENPDFVKDIPLYTLHALLQIADIPTFLLDYAQKGYQRQMVVEALEMHVAVAGEMSHGWHEAAEQKANYQTHYFNFLGRVDFEFLSYFVEFVPQKIFKDKSFRMALASNSKTPPEILEQLAQDRDRLMRTSVAGNKNIPANVLRDLANYSVVETREAVAKNQNTPADALKKLAKDKTDKIREAVANNEKTPLEVLKKLAKDKTDKIREMVARNWSTSTNILNELASDEVISVRQQVGCNPNTSIDTLKKLAIDESAKVRWHIGLTRNPKIEILEQLATDESSEVRSIVAINVNTPVHTLDKLARDKDSIVRAGVAGNPNIPLAISERLVNDRDPQVREAFVGFWNQNPPIKILEEFATHPDKLIREKVAYSHKSPVNVLEVLATDENDWVRKTVAENKNTPIHILEQLAQDQDSMVRAAVANKENLPSHLLKKLASDESSRVRYSVANNPNTPIEILKVLARDGSVSYGIVKNPRCNLKIRENIFKNIAKSEAPSYRRFVLFLSDYAESSVLAENSNSISWLERYAIAQNPKTPTDALKQLAQDGNRIVRATAKENLKKHQ